MTKDQGMKMIIQATVLDSEKKETAQFTLEYNGLDYKNVVEIEAKLIEMVNGLHGMAVKKLEACK